MKYKNSSKSKTKYARTDYAKWTSIMRKLNNEIEGEKQRIKTVVESK